MALSGCSGNVNERTFRERFMFLDWSKILNKIEHETANSKFQHILAGMYELALELIQMETKQKEMKKEFEKSYDNELLRKTKTIEALGSTIVKLAETRDLDVYIPEAYRILSCDSELLTPPLESETSPPKPSTNSSQQTPNKNDERELKRDESKNEKKTPLNKLIHIDQNYPKNDNDRNMINMNKNSQDSKETLKKQSKNDQEKVAYIENNFNIKTELTSQNLIELKPDQTAEDTSSDVSITDDSMWEINGTPTGRVSPILGMNIMRRRKVPSSQKKFEVSGSPKSKRKLSLAHQKKSRIARSTQVKMLSYLQKPKKTVDLGKLDFSASISDPKLHAMKMSTEDEDVILPSPTSETMRNTFSAKVRISEAPTSPPYSTPPAPPQDETDMMLGITGVEFDEPMETDILNASIDLLRGNIVKLEPTSPILCEIRNNSNTPVKLGYNTNVSVSVLRQPFRSRSERENVAPVCNKEPENDTKTFPKESPDVSQVECCITQFDAEESVSLLRHFSADQDVKKVIEKNSEKASAQPGHVYKEDPVRKKADKMKLPGWLCDKCRNYINSFYKDDPVMRDNMIERCSKHRGKFNPARPKTPPGFWDAHLSVPEDTEALNRLNNVA